MINVSTALATTPTRGDPAPTKTAGRDFKDTLDGLSIAPLADAPLVVPMLKVEVPALRTAALATSAKATIPTDIAGASSLVATAIDPALLIAPVAPPPAAEPDPATALLPALPTRRQALADDGKTVPAEAADDDPSKDVIWLSTALVPPMPTPVARPLTLPKLTAAIAPTSAPATTGSAPPAPITAPPAQAGAQSGEPIAPPPPSPNGAPASAGVAAETETSVATAKDGTPTLRLPETPKPDLPARADPVAATPPQPAQPQLTPAILPAGQVFAAAIAAAVQQGRDEAESIEPHTPLAIATAALERVHTPAITAPADARRAALDLRQDSGLQGMIDHIEVLRDGANAGDTRIRLTPDALGAVDVSVRRDGERLHVHFNAENQASARLIADAQPRLAELADARGVKLGQTSVDSGEGGGRQQQPAVPIQFTRPASVADTIETPDDLRVA